MKHHYQWGRVKHETVQKSIRDACDNLCAVTILKILNSNGECVLGMAFKLGLFRKYSLHIDYFSILDICFCSTRRIVERKGA